MASFRTNIVANLGGAAWIAGLTIAITPLQIHLLGIEAYGLVGLISILQVIFGALDLGLLATMTQAVSTDRVREVVGFRGDIQWDSSKPDGTPLNLLDTNWMKAPGWWPRFDGIGPSRRVSGLSLPLSGWNGVT